MNNSEEAINLSSDELNRTVVSNRLFKAPIADVFDVYADPAKLVRWWGPHGFTLTTESLDLREGGDWYFTFHGPDGKQYKNHVAFAKIARPHLFIVDHVSGPKYRGVFTFAELADQTKVTMHQTFEKQEVFEKLRQIVTEGNEGNFDRLGEVLEGQR